MMVPIHLISEVARPLSLSVRLFGNMMGEHTVIAMLLILSLPLTKLVTIGGVALGPPIPLALLNMAFSIFVSLIQAFIFALLAGVYIAGAIAVHEEELSTSH